MGTEGNGKAAPPKPIEGAVGSIGEDGYDAAELDFEGLTLREFVSREPSDARDNRASSEQTVEECVFRPIRLTCIVADRYEMNTI